MSIYEYEARNIRGKETRLEQYKDKVLLIVNTASKCGYTPQYSDLQKLHEKYQEQGLQILGFPSNQFGEQEPGSNEEVNVFCQINYGVTFPLFEKIDVKGDNRHPLFAYLTEQAGFQGFDDTDSNGKLLHTMLQERDPAALTNDEIKWNFTKFLIDRNGNVVERFESPVDPLDMEPAIQKLL
ncbi:MULTISPECIES: glutathione peroxidase [unclassified Paenibacillus]|jgi:glutathione peroxidase|uniref:glutathione peroxidase n=1 Tax=unclassified Paenibacillus TaxID=185978 RepID=UPI000574A25D|nr:MULTISPECIES: glutathione peroxidase [unclassified Paenibacillus]KHL95643.1 glutathione peroxidase [Paenibacillus sp. IHB B 3415]OMF23314.1 glutathione peroxidase [Paenibacillus sp. FSL H8-0259]